MTFIKYIYKWFLTFFKSQSLFIKNQSLLEDFYAKQCYLFQFQGTQEKINGTTAFHGTSVEKHCHTVSQKRAHKEYKKFILKKHIYFYLTLSWPYCRVLLCNIQWLTTITYVYHLSTPAQGQSAWLPQNFICSNGKCQVKKFLFRILPFLDGWAGTNPIKAW